MNDWNNKKQSFVFVKHHHATISKQINKNLISSDKHKNVCFDNELNEADMKPTSNTETDEHSLQACAALSASQISVAFKAWI